MLGAKSLLKFEVQAPFMGLSLKVSGFRVLGVILREVHG